MSDVMLRTNSASEFYESVRGVQVHSTSSSGVMVMPTFTEPSRITTTAVSDRITHLSGAVVDESDDERAAEEDVRGYVSRLWAEDWDSPEDQIYDRM